MSKDILQDAIGMIDDDILQDEHKGLKDKYPGLGGFIVAAVLVCSVSIGLILKLGDMSKLPEESTYRVVCGVTSNEKVETVGPYTENTWNQTGNAGRYLETTYKDNTYSTCLIAIHDQYRGTVIGKGTATGQDYYSLEIHTMPVSIYSVKGFDTECVVAVQFDENDEYVYAYMNANYVPKTLGDMMKALDFDNHFGTGRLELRTPGKSVMYESIDKDMVLKLLKSYKPAKNEPDKEPGKVVLTIAVSESVIGVDNKAMSFTEDGYVTFNILETLKCFYIGEEAVENLVEYVTKNCKEYVPNNDPMNGLTYGIEE